MKMLYRASHVNVLVFVLFSLARGAYLIEFANVLHRNAVNVKREGTRAPRSERDQSSVYVHGATLSPLSHQSHLTRVKKEHVLGSSDVAPSGGRGGEVVAESAVSSAVEDLSSQQMATNRSPKSKYINPRTTMDCHRREYTFKATRSDSSGRQCWQYITSMSCWGRCDSGEIADWRFPYKKSFHPICIHDKRRIRRIRLKNCSPGAEDELRWYEYTEAVSCVCQVCHSSGASCEGTPYGTRAP